jgi:8-oxo-dGTP pyrophosphatase MutT (NUDIX family)/ATP-dependent protease ClpP protease subunit
VEPLKITGLIGNREPELESILAENNIGENFTADMMRAYLAESTTDEIHIILNTIGGDVMQGFEMYDMLQAEKAKGREVIMDGIAYDSIGFLLFLAGTKRRSVKGSNPLIHTAWLHPSQLGDTPLNAEVLREIADSNEEADFAMLTEYTRIAGRDNMRILQDLMRNETQLTDQQLLEYNFATEIIAPIQAMKFQNASVSYNPKALKALKGLVSESYADVIAVKDGKILMIQRSLTDDFEGGKYAFPGGKIEEGEEPIDSARREFNEETGLTATNISFLEAIKNTDGTTSYYYSASVEGELNPSAREVEVIDFYDLEQIKTLPIIMDSLARYEDLILKSETMSDEVSAITKRINALLAFVKGSSKNMTLPLEGDGELFVFSEDGEYVGKRAVIAEGGEPTDTVAPAGPHKLRDGREITVGEGGIIETISESPVDALAAMETEKDKMAADLEAVNMEKEEMKMALSAAKSELDKFKNETALSLKALTAEIGNLKQVVPGDDDDLAERKVKNFKANKEEFSKMKPSERRLAMTIAARKETK